MSLRHSTREDWSNGSALFRGRYVGIGATVRASHPTIPGTTSGAFRGRGRLKNVPPPANLCAYVGGALIDQANGTLGALCAARLNGAIRSAQRDTWSSATNVWRSGTGGACQRPSTSDS